MNSTLQKNCHKYSPILLFDAQHRHFRMILLEVENRGVEEALKAHFELAKAKGRFDVVNANICDFDGCSYKLEQCQGNNDTLRVSTSTVPV